MKLELIREIFSEETTIGRLFIDGKFECYTLEDFDRFLENPNHKKVYGHSAIPAGEYKVMLSMSSISKKESPELLDVPRFEKVRIQSSNTPSDTDGYILVGKTKTNNFIGTTRDAFESLMKKLKEAVKNEEEITISIKRKGWDA